MINIDTSGEQFGARLKSARRLLGWSQKELATKSGVCQQAISFYESGKRLPDYRTLALIYKCTGCSFEYLFGKEGCSYEFLFKERLEKVMRWNPND